MAGCSFAHSCNQLMDCRLQWRQGRRHVLSKRQESFGTATCFWIGVSGQSPKIDCKARRDCHEPLAGEQIQILAYEFIRAAAVGTFKLV